MDIAAPTLRPWRKPQLIERAWLRWAITAGVLLYLWLALGSIDVNWARVSEGLVRAARLFAGFLQPDFTSRWSDIQQGLIESLTMTVCATVFGLILAVPIGLGAARNVSPI